MVRNSRVETLASLQEVVKAGHLWHILEEDESLAKLKQKKKTQSDNTALSSLKTLCDCVVRHIHSNCRCSSSYHDHIASLNGEYQKIMSKTLAMLRSTQRDAMMLAFNVATPAEMEIRNVKYERQEWMKKAIHGYMSLTHSTFRLNEYDPKLHITAPGLENHLEEAPMNTPLVDIMKEVLSSGDLLSEIAEKQLQPHHDVLETFKSDVEKMKTCVNETIEDMFNDTRDLDKIVEAYSAVCQQTSDFRDQLALFYLTHLRKYEYELDNIQGWTNTRNRLGGGAFGEVFKVQVLYKGRMTQAALKIGLYPYDVIPLPLTKENAILRNFLTEEDNLRKLKEPMDTSSDQRIHNQHIVEYYGTAYKRVPRGLKLGLVTELCEGTLADRIIGQRDHNPAWWGSDPEKQAAAFSYTQNLAVQLCQGLKIIHDAGYMHRDLKLINILVTHDDVVKLADVGQTKAEAKVTGTITGTALYAAPEVLIKGKMYNKSADIYSLGLILLEMWYGKTLYDVSNEDVAYTRQMNTDLEEGKDIRMPQWQGTVPPIPEWTRLIHDCLKKDPKERPNIQECLRRISAMKV
ncbi:hypothetical protein Bbelb_154370 [Branchiostoma belcheri]|nr:hypothetical protein Bbelb_154370 [Branchiostoma belcheri]